MNFKYMHKNLIFARLYRLSGLSHDEPKFIQLFADAGITVTRSQIHNWQRRRESPKYRPVPDYAFEILFAYLYEQKKSGNPIFG